MTKETWDELQELVLIVGGLIIFAGFEILCAYNETYASSQSSTTTRQALLMILSGIFTYKFTRSEPKGRGAGNGTDSSKPESK